MKQARSMDGVISLVLLGEIIILKSLHQFSRIDFSTSKSEVDVSKIMMSSANRRILTSSPDGSLGPIPLSHASAKF